MLHYKEFQPSKALEPYIKCYYTLESGSGEIIEDRACATGCIEIMFYLQGSQWQTKKDDFFKRTSPVELWGQILQPLTFRVSGHSNVFGIRFYPASAALLVREDISRFNQGIIDMASVLGSSIADLYSKLQEAKSVQDRIALVEVHLIQKLLTNQKINKIDLVRSIMTELAQENFFDNINNVASRYGISSRYLQKMFVQYTGLTPKLYTQINRFQNSLILMGRENISLTSVAYESGYFDQSHFIREFKSFAGITPSRFSIENSTAILASPNK